MNNNAGSGVERLQMLSGESIEVSSHKFKRLLEEDDFRVSNDQLFNSLTSREKEILRHIALGESNLQISEKLFVSSDTVRTHRNRIWNKLGIKNLAGAIRFAQAFDLI